MTIREEFRGWLDAYWKINAKATRFDCYQAGHAAALEKAAALAQTWGGLPPSPKNRRGKLAAAIRALDADS